VPQKKNGRKKGIKPDGNTGDSNAISFDGETNRRNEQWDKIDHPSDKNRSEEDLIDIRMMEE
jgi:hypothetical protein